MQHAPALQKRSRIVLDSPRYQTPSLENLERKIRRPVDGSKVIRVIPNDIGCVIDLDTLWLNLCEARGIKK